jgi:hypothetical protein
MKHILIQSDGTVRFFFVKQVAQLYQQIYGGTVLDGAIHEAEIFQTA